MATQSKRDTTENRLRRWQREAGWWDHGLDIPSQLPFAMPDDPTSPLTAAEDEEEDVLVTHYVDSVLEIWEPLKATPGDQSLPESAANSDEAGDTEALLEKGTHALVFGHSGEGKSTCRITSSKEASQRGFLVAHYLDVGRVKRDSQEHATAIVELIWATIHATGWPAVAEQSPQKTTPINKLASLTKLLARHCQGIFIFVDNVEDNLGPVWSMDDVGNAIEPLFDPQLLGLAGLRFKLFVPRQIARRVARYPAVNSDSKYGFRPFRIHWTKARLRQCLEDRLRDVVVSSPLLSLGAIADDNLISLDDQVIDAALSMPGAPRNLLRLAHEMIISHVRRERNPKRYRLTLEDFLNAKQHVFLARVGQELDEQERQLHAREDQLDAARHTGGQHMMPQIAAWLMQQLQDTNALNRELLTRVQQGVLVAPEVRERIESLLLRIDMRLIEIHTEATDIRSLVVQMRQEIIEAYDEGNRVMVHALLETMTRFQLQSVHLTIRAIESARLSQDEIEQAFATIDSALQSVRADVEGIDDELRDNLAMLDSEIKKAPSVTHKLKLALPLLPFLAYEVELKRNLHDDLMKIVGVLRKASRALGSAQHEGAERK